MTTPTASALYIGQVRHQRFETRSHRFRYSLFQVYLDLSELNTVFGRSWLWSTRRPALAWFRREDHLGRSHEPLETSVRSLVERETGNRPTGPIRLLTHLRYFGYVMNPVSFYFCFDEAGHNVEAIVAEVNNTPWGEQHCYVLGPHNAYESDDSTMRFEHGKEFHVSPFMSMKMRYRWRVTSPGERLAVRIACWRGEELLFTAELDLKRQPITPKRLRTVLLAYPLMTAKVFAAIYFEALRLWWKRVPYVPHPQTQPGTAPCPSFSKTR